MFSFLTLLCAAVFSNANSISISFFPNEICQATCNRAAGYIQEKEKKIYHFIIAE